MPEVDGLPPAPMHAAVPYTSSFAPIDLSEEM
jgi:hypothetical protein